MVTRILLSLALVALGIAGYRLLLLAQRWQARRGSKQLAAVGRPLLLVFTSPSCAPCKLQQLPIATRLMEELAGRAELRVVDVIEQPEVAGQFGVWSLPTTVVLDDVGKVVAVNQGVTGESALRAQLGASSTPRRMAP